MTFQPENTGSSALPLMVSVSDAPKVFGMSRSHAYRLEKQGLIEMVKMGRARMIITESMQAYISNLRANEAGSLLK
ncbi:hypothetical protein AA14337_0320 [Acetobacter malorum DSM 14337]|uniref:Helix-turn-helix domain-containing protein n=1 Tax=Acetobacter malorum DSM 14337 TaxID=1307910 RepID=A0ABQ0PM93_9PROT|nr:helix-turn-helix domain-containing protein [Acetobacter malorum]GBQ75773.1 hypothetical protein AA14337_0320 [Acetobacter malorum DSM 14337]